MRRSLALCLFPTITVPICRGRIQCPQVIREQPVGDLHFHCNAVIPSVFFFSISIVILCHPQCHLHCHPLSYSSAFSYSVAFVLFNLYTTDWPEVFFIFSSTVTKDPLKHTFVYVEEKLSIGRFQEKKFPKHPTLLICGPNEWKWSLLFSNHLFKHSPCLS